ncbi:MAG: CpsD/CapB family tyrosine-protein kinase [Bacilli bacterium]|nr:CpsD/CapB family tyrosine-protein kinase [Bacilli bacterium]
MKDQELIITKNPKSIFAESIRSIRTNLAFASIDNDVKVILGTSPEAGDGKSFVMANLAVAYAQEGKKVLLIDADLRRGRQHDIFEVLNVSSSGYTNLMLNYSDSINLSDYISKTKEENIDLLATGPTPPNPVELLGSENNKKLIKKLRKEYDIIILDCAPVIGLSDALILTTLSDVNLVVVSAKKTRMENLEHTRKLFEQANAKIDGVILNKVKSTGNHYYSYYYNNEYYSNEK